MRLGFEHHYAGLPAGFYTRTPPTPVAAPRLLAWNAPLAIELGIDPSQVEPAAHLLFSGARLPDDAQPLAMAYAGHQYAHFVPALGDGRAVLLGELRDRQGQLRDVQLKGAGRTPWSRGGDGRAAVGPMLREYLVSEAMQALGIPTTRSLAVVATGETVLREQPLPGAVLTRVAASHVRVGTFEYFAARADHAALQSLVRFCIERHDPALRDSPAPALDLLRAVVARQAQLIAAWMSVGFIHGVMNTDNMALSGETIDYGPCAFMDHYDPATVFSSIDRRGRYAYGNQPAIAQWNLARLAECLLPLIDADENRAVELATAAVQDFMPLFDAAWLARMRAKLGLAEAREEDAQLVRDLLQALQDARADFTLAFRQLADAIDPKAAAPLPALRTGRADAGIEQWLPRWQARLAREPQPTAARRATMQRVNPLYIPRNHRIEAALDAASTHGDLAPFHALLALVQQPYTERADAEAFTMPAADHERVLQTFCGT